MAYLKGLDGVKGFKVMSDSEFSCYISGYAYNIGGLGILRNQCGLNWKEKAKYLLIPVYLIAKNRNRHKDIRYIIWTFLHTMLVIDLISWALYFLGFGKLIYKWTSYSIFPVDFSFYLNSMTYIIGDWSLYRIIPASLIFILLTLSFFKK